MLRDKLRPLGAFAGMLVLSAVAWAQNLNFSQVDYYQDGALAERYSEWGQFDIGYPQSNDLGWVNVVMNPGMTGERWIVQNHPLLPMDATGTSSHMSTAFFDFGVQRGQNLVGQSFDFQVTYSLEPFRAQPTTGTIQRHTIASSQDVINAGVPSQQTTLNTSAGLTVNWNVPFTGLKGTWHANLPNVVQERNFCGPGAATNSLHWLAAQNNINLGQTLTQTQTELAGYMGNNNDGNWDDTEVSGKLRYFRTHNIPFEVHYTGGVMLPTMGNYNDPGGNGTARNDGAITWAWLQRELENGQDIELMTNTHWVVMEGLVHWDDIYLVAYRDDPYQHGTNTTAAEQQVIRDRHVWTPYFPGTRTINIGNGAEILRSAVAESLVPEPASIACLGVMVLSLLARRRSRR